MATFEYNALTSSGRLMKGTIEAGSSQEAGELLAQMQLSVNSIEKAKTAAPRTAIGRNEFLLFNQQLASITKAGIPLERGLRELSNDIASRKMKKLITAIADDLEKGISIEEAFIKREKHFPPLYGRILKAGVETGRLSQMLTNLNRHIETAGNTKRIIFEATAYPAVIFLLAAVIISGVLIFIIPQFHEVLSEMLDGGPMNSITTMIFAISRNVISFWVGIGLTAVAITGLWVFLSSFAAGRRFRETLALKIPVLGRLYHTSILSKMAEAMSMMAAAGCDMATMLRLSSQASGSEKMVLESDILATQIESGTNIIDLGQQPAGSYVVKDRAV
ncbi:MAG: type II secretion system F family protein, partial [Planctomycetes bacterium]|nr:type II secretion system F family protein [Planctomycetota bacterium]